MGPLVEAGYTCGVAGRYRLGNLVKNSSSVTSKRNWRLSFFLKGNWIMTSYFLNAYAAAIYSSFAASIFSRFSFYSPRQTKYLRQPKIMYAEGKSSLCNSGWLEIITAVQTNLVSRWCSCVMIMLDAGVVTKIPTPRFYSVLFCGLCIK